MKTDVFPLNYFISATNPVRSFLGRTQLNWPKLLLVLVFLNALLTAPVSWYYASVASFSIERVIPQVFDLLDETAVVKLQQTESSNGIVRFVEPFLLESEAGAVGGGLTEEQTAQLAEQDNYLLFEAQQIRLQESGTDEVIIPYTREVDFRTIRSVQDLQDVISGQWLVSNRVYLVAAYSLLIGLMLFSMEGMLIFGAALFIYFTRKSPLVSIRSYKESVNLIVNAITMPTVISTVIGIFHFDVTLLMTMQTVGLAFMLVGIYYRTRFSEEYVRQRSQQPEEVPRSL